MCLLTVRVTLFKLNVIYLMMMMMMTAGSFEMPVRRLQE
jgi:hypothetical protein